MLGKVTSNHDYANCIMKRKLVWNGHSMTVHNTTCTQVQCTCQLSVYEIIAFTGHPNSIYCIYMYTCMYMCTIHSTNLCTYSVHVYLQCKVHLYMYMYTYTCTIYMYMYNVHVLYMYMFECSMCLNPASCVTVTNF